MVQLSSSSAGLAHSAGSEFYFQLSGPSPAMLCLDVSSCCCARCGCSRVDPYSGFHLTLGGRLGSLSTAAVNALTPQDPLLWGSELPPHGRSRVILIPRHGVGASGVSPSLCHKPTGPTGSLHLSRPQFSHLSNKGFGVQVKTKVIGHITFSKKAF